MAETTGPAVTAGDELWASHARYRSLVEATAMDVWRADTAGDLIGDMPRWRDRTGQASTELLGNGWLDAIHPDHRDRVADQWRVAVMTGEPYEAEYPIRAADGTWRTVVARGTPVRAEDGTVREWVGTTDDITDQREAESRLREETRTVETLRSVGSALSAELDLQALVQVLTDATTSLTGAEFGAFFYNTVGAEGESFLLFTLSGATRESFEGFGLPRNTAIFAPTFHGEAPVRLDDVTTDPRYGRNPPHHGIPTGHLTVRSYLAVPVVSRTGEVHGGLFLGHGEPGRFTERHERLVVGVAAQAAVAIDNARLYEAERSARTDAEDAQARLQFLATAGELLAGTLDPDQAAARLAAICVPTLAEWTAVHVVDEAGVLRPAATFGLDGEPPEPYAAEGARSVPLRARGRVIGALTLGGPRRGPEDERLADELASRAALALDNAALYSRERRAALTLQRSLLPRAVPPLPFGSCAVRYLPGAAGAEVGGDWYDVIPVSGQRVVVVVGDVMGRGVGAAAVMGQLRSAVRAYALDDHEPAEVLHRVDRMVTTLDEPALTTCIVVRYDAATGEAIFATAGHLPPLLVRPDGSTTYLESDPGMPLGVGGAEFVQRTTCLDPGARLVLYTDGLVEGPTSPIDEGMRRLRDAASDALTQDLGAEDFADAVLAATRPGDEHDDDIALLVLAVHGHSPATPPDEVSATDREVWVPLEARPGSVKEARTAVANALAVWSLNAVEDVAVLLTSELVTNAIRHATGDLRLRVLRRPGGIRVEVHDRDATALPQLRSQDDALADGGRGIHFVAELATRWGVETLAGGKAVWFELDAGV